MEENKVVNNEENLIDLFEIIAGFLKHIKQRWWLFLFILCLITAGSVVREKFQYQEQFEASASFIVTTGGKEYVNMSSYYNRVTMEQLNTTFPYILTSGILSSIVAEDMGMPYVPGTISASVLQETNLFQIKVVALEPQLAYDILQSVIKNYPTVAKYVIGDTVLTLIDETGVPKAPMHEPAYKSAAVKGMLLGIVLCAVIIFLQIITSSTVKSQDDLKKFVNVKYLAGIPKERVKKRSRGNKASVILDHQSISPTFREAVHTLQIRISRMLEEKELKTLVVTSTLAEEGKTTVSCNLAYAMAEKGYKVLLVDGDFRNPSVSSVLNLPEMEYGIADILKGNIDESQVIQQYQKSSLWVLSGKDSQEKVTKLYRNGRLNRLVQKYSKEMDMIIIDTPPCGITSDAAMAADCADGILLVVRQDFARRDKILDGVEMLSSSAAPLVGYIINGEEVGSGSYGKYGYGKYGYGRYGHGRYGKYGYGTRTRN